MYKWERRAQKEKARKNRMLKSGRSIFVLQNIVKEKSIAIKKARADKNLPTE